jgi:ribonuclease P protein component
LLLLLTAQRPAVDSPGARVGVTVSSKVGIAVVRNRIKRWVRELLRRRRAALPALDLVVIARPSAALASHAALDAELGGLLERAAEERR